MTKGGTRSKASSLRKGKGKSTAPSSYPPTTEDEEFELGRDELDEDDEEDDDEFDRDGLRSGDREGEALIGGLEATRAKLAEATAEVDGSEEGIILGRVGTSAQLDSEQGNDGSDRLAPWAHRDIKPVRVSLSPSLPFRPVDPDVSSIIRQTS